MTVRRQDDLAGAARWIRRLYPVAAALLLVLSFWPPFGTSVEHFDGTVTVTRFGSLWREAHHPYSWGVPMLLCLLAAVLLLVTVAVRRAPNRGHLAAIVFPTGFLAAMIFCRAGTWTLDGGWATLTSTGALLGLAAGASCLLAFAHIVIVALQVRRRAVTR